MRLLTPLVKRAGQTFGFIFDKDPSNLWDVIVSGKSIGTVSYFSEINIGDIILTINGHKVRGMNLSSLTNFVESCNMLDITFSRNINMNPIPISQHVRNNTTNSYNNNNYHNNPMHASHMITKCLSCSFH